MSIPCFKYNSFSHWKATCFVVNCNYDSSLYHYKYHPIYEVINKASCFVGNHNYDSSLYLHRYNQIYGQGTEGTWRWESGKDFSPDHWIEGGPDNALLAEHCATINRNTHTWEDNYCGERHYYACEYYLSCPEEKKVLKSKKKFSLKLKH